MSQFPVHVYGMTWHDMGGRCDAIAWKRRYTSGEIMFVESMQAFTSDLAPIELDSLNTPSFFYSTLHTTLTSPIQSKSNQGIHLILT